MVQIELDMMSKVSPLLGVFEMVLGLMLIVEPYGRSTFFYVVVSIWALVGGSILIADALRMLRASRNNVHSES